MSIKATAKKSLGLALNNTELRDEAIRFEVECAQERASRVDRSRIAEARRHEECEKLRIAEADENLTSEELVPLRATVALAISDADREANFCSRADTKWEASRRAVAVAQGAVDFEQAMIAKSEIAKAMPPLIKATQAFNTLIDGNRTLQQAFADSQIGSSTILAACVSWLDRFREELRTSTPPRAPWGSVMVEIVKPYSANGSFSGVGQFSVGERVALDSVQASAMVRAGFAVRV